MAILGWSTLTAKRPYPQPSFDAPDVPTGVLSDISLGPVALNDSQGRLNTRYWLVTQLDGQVLVQGATGVTWAAPVVLFDEPVSIRQIQLTFDQLGRPLVLYRVGENTLKLYWYDPVLQQNILATLATGLDPEACFDFPQDTGQSFTDILLFYQRGEKIYMRVQRDRFAIEYEAPAVRRGFSITSSGLRVDNRVQVTYLPVRDPGRFD